MFKLTVVTPEKRLVVGQEIDEVTVPGFRGELNVLPGHAPLITTLETGVLRWKLKGSASENVAAISWGYCEIHPEGVDILADVADLPGEVDIAETNRLMDLAEKRLASETLDDADWKQVHREIARYRADLEIAGKTH